MNGKTSKTILFALLIAAMILPFSGMQAADAEVNVKYNKSEVDKSFRNSEGYVSYEAQNNQMIVDVKKMTKDNLDAKDIKIMKSWAKLHNSIMVPYMIGDKTGTFFLF